MSKQIIYLLLLFSATCYCQSYEEIDQRVKNYPKFKTVKDLSIRIQNNFSTKENRIRAAYSWVAINIEYKQKPLKKFLSRINGLFIVLKLVNCDSLKS